MKMKKPAVDPLTLALLRDGFTHMAHGTDVLENYLAQIAADGRHRPEDGLDWVMHHTENLIRNNITSMAAVLAGQAFWQKLARSSNWGAYGSVFRAARFFPASVHERMAAALYAYSFDHQDSGCQADYALWQAEWAVMVAKIKAATRKRKERETMVCMQAPQLLRRLYDIAMTLRDGKGHADFERLQEYFKEMEA